MKRSMLFALLIMLFAVPSYAVNAPTVQNVDVLGGSIQVTATPIYISGDTIDTATAITKSDCVIVEIYWYGATTIGHKMAIKDADDNMIFPMQAVVANQGLHSGRIRIELKNGIYMDDLDSGAVLIVLETK